MTTIPQPQILVLGAKLQPSIEADLSLSFEYLPETECRPPLIIPRILLGANDNLFGFELKSFPYKVFSESGVNIGFLYEQFSVHENPSWIRLGWDFNSVGEVLLAALERIMVPAIKVCFNITPLPRQHLRVNCTTHFKAKENLTLTDVGPYEDESRILSKIFAPVLSIEPGHAGFIM